LIDIKTRRPNLGPATIDLTRMGPRTNNAHRRRTQTGFGSRCPTTAMTQHDHPSPRRTVACPVCSKPVEWTQASRYRPFCSERCKIIDLGAWAAEAYRVPDAEGQEPDLPPEDAEPGAKRDRLC
jgi:uncharacterized protein